MIWIDMVEIPSYHDTHRIRSMLIDRIYLWIWFIIHKNQVGPAHPMNRNDRINRKLPSGNLHTIDVENGPFLDELL